MERGQSSVEIQFSQVSRVLRQAVVSALSQVFLISLLLLYILLVVQEYQALHPILDQGAK